MVIISVVLITTIAIMLVISKESEDNFYDIHNNYSKNIVNFLKLNVNNQYKSILFHKSTLLNIRKAELKNITDIIISVIDNCYSSYKAGHISEKRAKQIAIIQVSNFRYNNGIGYFWINDTGRPFPKMISHATTPSLNGKILDNKEFNCALGKNENLFVAFVDVCMKNGEGYVDYLWSKPVANGLTQKQPKISYVKLYKKWNWIIGSGVYIDDIENDVNLRIEAVKRELNESMTKLYAENNSYAFIFNSNKELIIHPFLAGTDALNIKNKLTGNPLFDDLVSAYKSGKNYVDYIWNKPNDTANFIYQKRAYLTYFKPLDWYIASTFYIDDINAPINKMKRKIVIVVIIVFLFSVIISILFANSITRPILLLSNRVKSIKNDGILKEFEPITTGSREIVEFSFLLNEMISSIIESQNALNESEDKFKNYIEYAPEGIIITDNAGFVKNANPKASDITGYYYKELIKKNIFDFVNENKNIFIKRAVLSLKKNNFFEGETVIIHKTTHKKVYVLISSITLNNSDILIFLRNIDYIKEYQKELVDAKIKAEDSNKLKSAFLANMSHEIRTPMNGVVGFSELLTDENITEEERRKYTEIIKSSSLQLLSIVNDIIDISKIETGHIKVNISEVNLFELMTNLENIYSPIALKKGVNLILDRFPEVLKQPILSDATKIRQVLENLINNALKFTSKGVIKFGCDYDGKIIKFHVKDTGIGISKDMHNVIFERFRQAENVKIKQIKGTGLGLAISKAYIEMLGGKIWVESKINQGAEFFFTILRFEINSD